MESDKISTPDEFIEAIAIIAEMTPSLADDPTLRDDLAELQPWIESYREWKRRRFSQQEALDKEGKMATGFEKLVADIKRIGPEAVIGKLSPESLELLEHGGIKDDIENHPAYLAYLLERQWHYEWLEEDHERRWTRREIIIEGTLGQVEVFVKHLMSKWWSDPTTRLRGKQFGRCGCANG